MSSVVVSPVSQVMVFNFTDWLNECAEAGAPLTVEEEPSFVSEAFPQVMIGEASIPVPRCSQCHGEGWYLVDDGNGIYGEADCHACHMTGLNFSNTEEVF
jgi:hypothetical protein